MTDPYLVIAITFFGFIGLAFALLFPVYRFLTREEEQSETWTPEALARRQAREGGGDGAAVPRTPPAEPEPERP